MNRGKTEARKSGKLRGSIRELQKRTVMVFFVFLRGVFTVIKTSVFAVINFIYEVTNRVIETEESLLIENLLSSFFYENAGERTCNNDSSNSL